MPGTTRVMPMGAVRLVIGPAIDAVLKTLVAPNMLRDMFAW